MPKVSVVIPCYNQGRYLDETLVSVQRQSYEDYEIIIVNDGSNDEYTVEMLHSSSFLNGKVIHTENQGLPSARNTGIQAALGEYILPLDSDDLLGKEFLRKAVEVLDADGGIGIVSCGLKFFGEINYAPVVPEFSVEKMLINNLLTNASLFRKADWEKVGGYNPNMRYGWEDWDFWLSLLESGVGVHKIPEVLFHYRIRKGSMLRSMDRDHDLDMYEQLYRNHPALYSNNIRSIFGLIHDYNRLLHSKKYRYMNFLTDPMHFLKRLG